MQKKIIVAVLIVAGALMLSGVPVFAQAAPAASAQPQAASDQDIQALRQDLRAQEMVEATDPNRVLEVMERR